VFSECGAWRNFHDLEESLSLEELMCLYEAAMIRQGRAIRAMASAWGGGGDAEPEPSYSARMREASDPQARVKNKKYMPAWAVDPKVGGEVSPVFSEKEASSLPINLGYSIISDED
jgi:hypothetical protein